MNLERLRWGEWIAGIAALDLVLVTFRAWYKVSGTNTRVTAWDALDSGRYLLLVTAGVGLLLFILTAANQVSNMSVSPGYVTGLVGLVCTGYIAYRLATPPEDNLDPVVGIYIGLVGALGVAIGGFLAARQPAGAYEAVGEAPAPWATSGATGPQTGAGTWTPAPPVAAATPTPEPMGASSVPPATAGGGLGATDMGRSIQAGDDVELTTGGSRFPAGTIAQVVQVFAGGALVEVVASDGVAERFEVPDEAYERVGAGRPPSAGTAVAEPPRAGGESWSPAMPAPADAGRDSDDWGFDDTAKAAGAGAIGGAAAGAFANGDRVEEAPAEKKVPWWKREIGGKKKDADVTAAAATPAAEEIAEAAPAEEAAEAAPAEKKVPWWKREIGGKTKRAEEDTAPEETEAAEPEAAELAAEPEPEPEPEPVVEPEPAAAAPEPEPEPEPEPAPPAPAQEPEPAAAAPEPEPVPPAPAPEPEAAAPESAPEPTAPTPQHEPEAAAPVPEPEPEPKPRRKSSASRKVPREAVEAAEAQPKVGDEVQLKVSGGKWDAGTRGTVVDVFAAGVIVEVEDDAGRTERLDLPFEAVGKT